jgi:hypothetical protein
MKAIQSYFDEVINWGGIPTPRGTVITTMQEEGFTRKEIDWYLFCLDAGKERRERLGQQTNIAGAQ